METVWKKVFWPLGLYWQEKLLLGLGGKLKLSCVMRFGQWALWYFSTVAWWPGGEHGALLPNQTFILWKEYMNFLSSISTLLYFYDKDRLDDASGAGHFNMLPANWGRVEALTAPSMGLSLLLALKLCWGESHLVAGKACCSEGTRRRRCSENSFTWKGWLSPKPGHNYLVKSLIFHSCWVFGRGSGQQWITHAESLLLPPSSPLDFFPL